MTYKKVSLDLTQTQARKAGAGKTINISAAQLKGSGVSLHVHPSSYEKIVKAQKGNKGVRLAFTTGEMKHDLKQGGSLWSFLKDKLWPAIKPAVSQALDLAVAPISGAVGPYAPFVPAARQAVKSLTGVGVAPKKLGKGTAEAKAHMAKLRAMRKGGARGGSFKL